MNTPCISFAVILAAVRGHRHSRALEPLRKDILYFARRRKRSHSRRTENIDRTLHHHGAGGRDGKLQRHRKPDANLLPREGTVDSPHRPFGMKHFHFFPYEEEAEHSGDSL